MTQPIFNTQYHYQQQTQQFKRYIHNIDNHIFKALKSQNTLISLKKKQLVNQLEHIQQQKKIRSIKFNQMEQYFIQMCQNVLKDDITKWKHNQHFYKQLFYNYDQQIQQKINHISQLKHKANQLKLNIKTVMKQARKIYVQSTSRMEKNSIQSKSNAYLNSLKQIKEIPQFARISTQASLPTLQKHKKHQKVESIIGIQSLRSTQDLIKYNYMNPIKTVKTTYTPTVSKLSQMLEWYHNEKSKNQDYNWFDKVILYERNYNKLQKYLKKNMENGVRRVTTQI